MKRYNPETPRVRLPSLLMGAAALIPLGIFAQNQPGLEGEPVLELSPFVVETSSEVGYLATQTLAGTRLKGDLKDVGSSVTILTQELMEDLAITSLEDAIEYVGSTEETLDVVTDNGNGVFALGLGGPSFVSRGGLTGTISRDFFRNRFQPDSFSTERFTFSQGPNAVLFGEGNPYGVFSSVSKRASLRRERHQLQFRVDDNGSVRAVADMNMPVIQDKLAVRVALLHDDTQSWQKPVYSRDNRYYATTTWRPFKTTTLHVNYEGGEIKSIPARPWPLWDNVTIWNGLYADNPDAGFVNGVQGTGKGKPIPVGVKNFSPRTRYIVNEFSPAGTVVPGMNWVNTGVSQGPHPRYGFPAAGNYSLTDASLFPIDVAVTGHAIQRYEDYKNLSAFLEQQIGDDLFIELAFNKSETDIFVNNGTAGIFYSVFYDVNKTMPNGQPNPNVGMMMTDSPSELYWQKYEDQNLRATVSYEFNFKDRFEGWMKHFGRHTTALMWQTTDRETWGKSVRLYNLNDPNPLNFATSRVFTRHYFDASAGKVWMERSGYGTYPVYKWGDPLPVKTPGVVAPAYLPADNPTLNADRIITGMFVVQSFFFDDRMVFTYGTRKDKLTQYKVTGDTLWGPLKDSSGFAADSFQYTKDDFAGARTDTSDNNFSKGVVFHALSWLSLYYNSSTNFAEPGSAFNIYGERLPNPGGEGVDYGLRFSLLDRKIVGSIGYYEVNSINGADGGVRSGTHGNFSSNIATVWQNYATFSGDAKYGQYPYVPGTTLWTDVSTNAKSGIEASITTRLTDNWNFIANFAYQFDPELKDRGVYINRYLNEYMPFWREQPAAFLNIPLSDLDDEEGGEVETVGTLLDTIDNILAKFNKLAESPTAIQTSSRWRANFVTSYKFGRDSRLDGFALGGAVRLRGPQLIGFAKDAAGLLDGNRPFEGEVSVFADAWLRYRGHLGSLPYTIQLNIKNLLDDSDLVELRAADDGNGKPFITRYKLNPPRSFQLSTTIHF